jgi:O-antigen ligase
MASYLAPLLFWALYFVLARPSRAMRAVAGIAALLMITALIVGGTRGPWLAVLMAAVPYYMMLAASPAYRRPLLFSAGLGILVVVALLLIPNPLVHVQFDLQKRLLGSKEIAARFYYWLMAIQMFKDHPIFGIGYGNFDIQFWDYVDAYQRQPQSEYFRYVLQETIRGVRPGFVHNDHLQVLAESGLVGLVAWLGLWTTLLHQGLVAARRWLHDQRRLLVVATFLASLICFGVDALTNFPFHVPVSGFLFWVTVGLWTAYYERESSGAGIGTRTPDTIA